MKIKLLLSAVFSVLIALNVNAQHKHSNAKKKAIHHKKAQVAKANYRASMAQSMKFIKKTSKVLTKAYESVKKGKKYTGNLSKAIEHQKYAKTLLARKMTHRAVQHSRAARKYAMMAIRQNRGKIDNSWNTTAEEKEILGTAISNDELEKELKATNPDLTFNDEKVSDKDMTEIEVLKTDPADYKNE